MRVKRVDISLTLIVPLIIGGTAALGVIIAYRYFPDIHLFSGVNPRLFWAALGAAVGASSTSLLLLKLILGPVRQFLSKAHNMEVLQQPFVHLDEAPSSDDLGKIEYMFDRVSSVLDKIDAQALFPEIIGQSACMRMVLKQVLKVAATKATVLIQGESGTGKELIARSIQAHSDRSGKPFVIINCASIPEGLLESELFGHEKGAFTDAIATQRGKFELASGGTIFLDEIGDMPQQTQVKILRVLESGECERIGGKTIKVDVRVIAATHRNIKSMVDEGTFREDLFHRLHVVPLFLPPLRSRREDIPALASHFLNLLKPGVVLSPEALNLLIQYTYSGNVRELKNIIEHAAVMSEGNLINVDSFPSNIISGTVQAIGKPLHSRSEGIPLDTALAEFEEQMIRKALKECSGIQVRAATLLGIKERSLWHRIKKYGIDVQEFK